MPGLCGKALLSVFGFRASDFPIGGCQMGGAPLIPKLRGYFAEFLREVSLARLSLLDSPTCVGLRYGQLGEQMEAFLGTLSGDALRAEP